MTVPAAPAPPITAPPTTSTKMWVPLILVGSGALAYVFGKADLRLSFAGASELADAMVVGMPLITAAATWFSRNYLKAPVTVETPVGQDNVHLPAGIPWWYRYAKIGGMAVGVTLVGAFVVLAWRLL